MELTQQQILDLLKDTDTPDTRALQKIRIENIGKATIYGEQYTEKEANKTPPRIVALRPDEQAKVYSLAIPFSFPSCDPTGSNSGINRYFNRWTSTSHNRSAMHLTTQEDLNKLIEIFAGNKIPIKVSKPCGPIRGYNRSSAEGDWDNPPGIEVPHSWDELNRMFYHQFIPWSNFPLVAIPFWGVETLDIEGQMPHDLPKPPYLSHYPLIETGTLSFQATMNRYFVKTEVCSPAQLKNTPIKEALEKRLGEDMQRLIGKEQYFKGERDSIGGGIVKKASARIIKIGDKLELYDPSWISSMDS